MVRGQVGVESLTWVAGSSSPPVYYNQVRDEDRSPTYASAVIKTTEPALARSLEQILQDTLPTRFPDAQLIVKAFGQGPPIAFRLIGPDADRLREFGEQLRALIHEQPQVLATRAAVTGGDFFARRWRSPLPAGWVSVSYCRWCSRRALTTSSMTSEAKRRLPATQS